MSKPRKVTYIDGRLAFAQMDEDAKRVIVRAALSQHMAELGRRVDNRREDKRAIIAAAQRKRWAEWRSKRLAEQHAYNTSKGLPLDTPLPVIRKPRPTKALTRREALDIAYKELERKFPQGMTESNKAEFMSFVPSDPRLKPFL